MSRFLRLLILCMFSLFAFSVLTGCPEEPPDHFASVRDAKPDPVNAPTSNKEAIEAHTRSILSSAGHSAASSFLFAGIFLLPIFTILIIPGVIFGRLEKPLEGIVLVAGGLFFMLLADSVEMKDLSFWALVGNVIPGALLFCWGIISDKNEGKLILIGIPMLGMALVTIAGIFLVFFSELLNNPVFAILSLLPGCGCIWTKLKYFREED